MSGAAKRKWLEGNLVVDWPPSMTKQSSFRYFNTSPEIIRLAVMMYVRFPLSLQNVEDLLHERGSTFAARPSAIGGADLAHCSLKLMKPYGRPQKIVTDRLRSCRAAMNLVRCLRSL